MENRSNNPRSNKPRVSAIVMAAGTSRRMGTPKQLLRAGDRTLLELTLDNVRESCAHEIILVLGFTANEIQRQIPTQDLTVVVNPVFEEGMSTSLRKGIGAMDSGSEAALIVLGDQPCVRPETLDRLIDHYQRGGSQIIIPTYQGFRGNPVLLDRSVFAEVMEIKGDVGCRAIFGSHTENIAKLDVGDAGILLDFDTREDVEKFIASGRQPPGLKHLPDLEGGINESGQPELVVVGRDAVAFALLRFGKILHFTTTIVDPLLPLDDAPDADRVLHRLDLGLLRGKSERYIVVASRGQFDEDALEQALRSETAYVGLLGNKKRAQELKVTLQRKVSSRERLDRMRAPAGLDIGAESPEEIALSIMAEIVAKRNAGRLELP